MPSEKEMSGWRIGILDKRDGLAGVVAGKDVRLGDKSSMMLG